MVEQSNVDLNALLAEHSGDKQSIAWAAIARCRQNPNHVELREALRQYVLKHIAPGHDSASRLGVLRLLRALGAKEDAAAQLTEMIPQALTATELDACFRHVPDYLERGERGAIWSRMLRTLTQMVDWPNRLERLRAISLELRLLLALGDFPTFVDKFSEHHDSLRGTPHSFELGCVHDRLRKSRREVFAEGKLFGIGLARTGTTSLSAALRLLGIDTAHWTNPLTNQLISDIDLFMFSASTDCCVANEFEKLYYLYPNAHFIWTQRPLQSWLKSFQYHQWSENWATNLDDLRTTFGQYNAPHMLSGSELHFGLYLNYDDLTRAYDTFNKRVTHFFSDKPSAKLLRFDVFSGDGWPELCRFLHRPLRSGSFPLVNTAADWIPFLADEDWSHLA